MKKLTTVLALSLLAASALADDKQEPLGPVGEAARPRYDLAEVQGIMAVQRLDGWLLYDLGDRTRSRRTWSRRSGIVTRRWFYLVPAKGDPIALVPRMEAIAFTKVPGRKIEYSTWRELDAA